MPGFYTGDAEAVIWPIHQDITRSKAYSTKSATQDFLTSKSLVLKFSLLTA